MALLPHHPRHEPNPPQTPAPSWSSSKLILRAVFLPFFFCLFHAAMVSAGGGLLWSIPAMRGFLLMRRTGPYEDSDDNTAQRLPLTVRAKAYVLLLAGAGRHEPYHYSAAADYY